MSGSNDPSSETGDAKVVASGARRPFSGTVEMPSTRARLRILAAGVAVIVFLVSTSTAWRVGDGAEYLAMALRLSEFKAPAMTPAEIRDMQSRLLTLGHGFNGVPLGVPWLTGSDGRQDQPHFWFYPILAVPEIWLLKLFGLPPYYAFTLLNSGLLLAALWIGSATLNWPALLLVFLSPVIWWLDKAHTEIFTFSLLAIAMATMVDRPWWALVSLALASTQNPPLAVLLPVFFLIAAAIKPMVLSDRRLYLGSAAAILIAALAPLYYGIRFKTSTIALLTGGTPLTTPSLARFLVFVSDPNFGLIVWCPFLVLTTVITAIALGLRKRALLLPALISFLIALGFMYSFAQTSNLNSGGTFGMARYAVWLIPLAIPLLAKGQATFGAKFDRWLIQPAMMGVVWSLLLALPSYPEAYLYPTWLANQIWLYHPSLNNPPAEVFYERVTHSEGPIGPAATASCSKILLLSSKSPPKTNSQATTGGPTDVDQVVQYAPACAIHTPIPLACKSNLALCYANRTATGYEIVPAPP